MTYIAVLVCYILVWISAAQDPYNIFDDEKKWEKAKQVCNMATPEINYKDMTVSVQTEQDPMPELWTGYYRTMIGFEYFGCVKKSSASSSRILEIERNSPGHCYSACGKNKIVGLNNRTCYCLNQIERPVINEASCYISCPAPFAGIACGGKYHMSLYRINANVSSGITGITRVHPYSHCVRIETTKRLLWYSCSGLLQILCENEQSVHSPVRTTDQQNFAWNIANNKCFENNQRPVTYAKVLNAIGVNVSGVSWTGMCRSFVLFKYTESHIEDIHIEYGYLKRYAGSSKIYLRFTYDKNVKKKTLCKYDPLETTSLESTALTTVTTQGESGDEITSSHATTNILPSSNNITRTEEKEHGENNRIDAVLPAGISAATILVVIAILVLKRKHKSKFCGGEQQATNIVYENSLNNNANTDRNIGTVALVNLSTGLQNPDDDSYYEEPLSVQAMNRFHNYDTPPSNQQTMSRHYDEPNYGDTVGPYESLGQRNTNTYDTIHN